MPAQQCDLCVSDRGVYEFGRVCCCARFVSSLPLVRLRRGWMELFKVRKSADVYAQIEAAVKARWVVKNGELKSGKEGNVG